MRRVEASGKTRKEAVEVALAKLGAELHEVKVEVLDEGSRGFLGLGARDVKVRVSLDTGEDDFHGESAVEADPETENRAADAAALLREMIERMEIRSTVRHQVVEGGSIRLSIDSPDSAILIGRKGKTLAALQYLINRMINTGEDPDKSERILVDVEGYLDRRRDSLEELAQRLAQRAKETRKRVRLKPLDPQERRIIHMTLQDDPEVETYSVGNASIRSVIIQPKGMAKTTDDVDDRPVRRDRDRDREGAREGARAQGGSDRTPGDRGNRRRRGRGRGRGRDGAETGGEADREAAPAARAPQGERREGGSRGNANRRSDDRPRSGGGNRREGASARSGSERRGENGSRGADRSGEGGRREGGGRRDSGARRRPGGAGDSGGGRRPAAASPMTQRSSALMGNGPIDLRARNRDSERESTPTPLEGKES